MVFQPFPINNCSEPQFWNLIRIFTHSSHNNALPLNLQSILICLLHDSLIESTKFWAPYLEKGFCNISTKLLPGSLFRSYLLIYECRVASNIFLLFFCKHSFQNFLSPAFTWSLQSIEVVKCYPSFPSGPLMVHSIVRDASHILLRLFRDGFR